MGRLNFKENVHVTTKSEEQQISMHNLIVIDFITPKNAK